MKVEGSNPFSRSNFLVALSDPVLAETLKDMRRRMERETEEKSRQLNLMEE